MIRWNLIKKRNHEGKGSTFERIKVSKEDVADCIFPIMPREDFLRRMSEMCDSYFQNVYGDYGMEGLVSLVRDLNKKGIRERVDLPLLIGGAVVSSLSVFGVAAYAISRIFTRKKEPALTGLH